MSLPPVSPIVLVKGAGEMASGVAWRLHRANIRRLVLLDLPNPLCVRRTVSFCEALIDGSARVDGVDAVAAGDEAAIEAAWSEHRVPVVVTERWARLARRPRADVVVDAILAKRNIGTARSDAPLVVALGPGFEAGIDCHAVIETNRGHDLGRVLYRGPAQPDTGIPGEIGGFDVERLLRAPRAGTFASARRIGEAVERGEVVGYVDGAAVTAAIPGILRGLIRPGTRVGAGLKIGDVDPRDCRQHCDTVSDKARAIAGGVLEAIMMHCNRSPD